MSKNEEIAVLQENTPKMRKWSFEPNVHIHAHKVSWF